MWLLSEVSLLEQFFSDDFSYDYSYKTIIDDKQWIDFLSHKNTSLIDLARSIRPCNFFEQSTCVTTLQKRFDDAQFLHDCLPKCYHSTFDQKKIHVSDLINNSNLIIFSTKLWIRIKLITIVWLLQT